MEAAQIARLLDETLSFDAGVVRAATEGLDRLSPLPSFPYHLLLPIATEPTEEFEPYSFTLLATTTSPTPTKKYHWIPETDLLIQMLLNASKHILTGLDSQTRGSVPKNAQILMRILCHKKDREASKFLKRQYQLPMASEYDDTPSKDSVSSAALSDVLKRSASVNWSERGQKSLRSFKQKIQEATSEIRHAAW